jgi:hypothetical protein
MWESMKRIAVQDEQILYISNEPRPPEEIERAQRDVKDSSQGTVD